MPAKKTTKPASTTIEGKGLMFSETTIPVIERPKREKAVNPFTDVIATVKANYDNKTGKALSAKATSEEDLKSTIRQLRNAARDAGVGLAVQVSKTDPLAFTIWGRDVQTRKPKTATPEFSG